MGIILVIIIAILLFGAGGGYYGYRRYGGPGLGGVVAVVLVIFLVIWLAGWLHPGREGLNSTSEQAKPPVFLLLGKPPR